MTIFNEDKDEKTFDCDFLSCEHTATVGAWWDKKVPNGWVGVYVFGVERHFCGINHAMYYLADPIKHDKDFPDDILDLGIT